MADELDCIIERGPVIQPPLASEFVRRVEAFKAILAEVETIPLERTLDSFRRDHNPEKELALWEKIAGTYQDSLAEFGDLSPEKKKGILGLLLGITAGSSDFEHHSALTPDMIVWIVEDFLGRHIKKGRAGLESEYPENVPSDLGL